MYIYIYYVYNRGLIEHGVFPPISKGGSIDLCMAGISPRSTATVESSGVGNLTKMSYHIYICPVVFLKYSIPKLSMEL